VINSGSPAPALAETGALPTNVKFLDNANGTATFRARLRSERSEFPINITAVNGTGTTTQAFILVVGQAPASVALGAAPSNSQFGGSVLLTATVPTAKRARLTLSPS